MASRAATMSLYVIVFAVVPSVASAQDTNHGRKPRDPPVGSLSAYNTITKHYEPVSPNSWAEYRYCLFSDAAGACGLVLRPARDSSRLNSSGAAAGRGVARCHLQQGCGYSS
jgi:hypothetical protein